MSTKERQSKGYLFKRWRGKHLSITSDIPATIYLAYRHLGIRYTLCLHTSDVAEAKAMMSDVMGRIAWSDRDAYLRALVKLGEEAQAELHDRRWASTDIALPEVWDSYQNSKRRPSSGPKMMQLYCGQYRAFCAWAPLKVKSMRHVTPPIAEQYAISLERTLSSPTVNQHLNALRLIWRTLQPDRPNPWDGLHSTKRHVVYPYRRLSLAEVRLIVSKATPEEHRLLYLIGYTTGLRLHDAVHVRWDDIDWATQSLTLVPRKTSRMAKRVTIPLIPLLLQELEAVRQDTGPILPHLTQRYDSCPAGVSQAICRYFRDIGVTNNANGKASFHSFRVTWQSLNDEAGTNRVIARKVLGHSSATMSDTYSRVDVDVAREAVTNAIPSLEE